MAKTKAAPPPPSGDINVVSLADALSTRYLSYALSTIMARSLPDVRDGLKPVHRRLLYAMRQLHLDPGSGFKKSARVVGDVMGKFHPHGDASIYDAMVRLAQDFAQRYPMVDGQGNFGNIDGDNPAAMRYTEARLTEVAALMLEGINEDAVDFRPTYDGEGQEPLVLPGAFPNLLANGAQGIAVGMATSIPPHNIGEICDALLHLIKSPNATIASLVKHIKGPDFPTGGILVEDPASILEAYKTGRGSFRVRAKWTKEDLKGGTWQAVITEIPYQVPKSRLIEKVADLLQQKKLPLLDDVHDESTTDVRIVLEPKSRNVDPDHLMEQLFRQTDLEIRFGLNMNVLGADQTPRVMSLPEVLRAFLDHRREVLLRRSRFRLADIERRLEVLGGLLIAYLNIDEVIRIIRREDDPKAKMMKKWDLTEIQADAILNMKLKALRKLEEIEIRKENDDLTAERKTLKGLLKDEDKQWERVAAEIGEIKKRFGPKTELGRRRTELGTAPADVEIPMEALVERENVTVVCSAKGWVRALKGHVAADEEIKFKEGDRPRFHIQAETTDKLVVLGTNGRFYTIGIDKLPGGRGFGEPLKLMIDLGEQDPVGMFVHKPGRKLIVASTAGRGFVAPEEEIIAQTRAGKQVLNLAEGEEAAAYALIEEGDDHVAVVGTNRKLLLFPMAELPEMTRGRGVILQKYKDGGLSDVKSFRLKAGLTWRSGDRSRTETALKDWVGQRAQAGRLPPQGFPRSNKFL
ncbi:MAG TPA: DNA topoisomerase IV subunit A [Hypericibacter adhaerens]|uniref:DNA topoisomerase IV subunit A n=1 Tax=Hypericibacter adhaerens TaxID=2602016 RepID=UPI002BF6CB00|nr:DNA topoisomerase IV subunit A [Hypericibacter adhaerens]HWA44914.1 DNA topoisomerase IV subunit A [Hypericibacter adhaerens]